MAPAGKGKSLEVPSESLESSAGWYIAATSVAQMTLRGEVARNAVGRGAGSDLGKNTSRLGGRLSDKDSVIGPGLVQFPLRVFEDVIVST